MAEISDEVQRVFALIVRHLGKTFSFDELILFTAGCRGKPLVFEQKPMPVALSGYCLALRDVDLIVTRPNLDDILTRAVKLHEVAHLLPFKTMIPLRRGLLVILAMMTRENRTPNCWPRCSWTVSAARESRSLNLPGTFTDGRQSLDHRERSGLIPQPGSVSVGQSLPGPLPHWDACPVDHAGMRLLSPHLGRSSCSAPLTPLATHCWGLERSRRSVPVLRGDQADVPGQPSLVTVEKQGLLVYGAPGRVYHLPQPLPGRKRARL
jgi:hypothetical protein